MEGAFLFESLETTDGCNWLDDFNENIPSYYKFMNVNQIFEEQQQNARSERWPFFS